MELCEAAPRIKERHTLMNMAGSLARIPLDQNVGRRLQLQFREQGGRQGRHGLHCCIGPQCGRERSTVPYWNLHVYATCSQCEPFLVLLHRTVLVLCCSLLLTGSPSLTSYLFYRQFTVLVHVHVVNTCRTLC